MSKDKKTTGAQSGYATVKNFYDAVPKKHRMDERTYDNYDKIKVDIPFRMCLAGRTGSGKTNVVMNIIDTIRDFDKVLLFAKDLTEPLYATLIDTLREAEKKSNQSILTTSSDLDNLPAVDSNDKKLNTLLIVDDMITENKKKLIRVEEYAIRGRKVNVTLMFLTQDYFAAPIRIRKNCDYVTLNNIGTVRDLKTIVKDYSLKVPDDTIVKMYEHATKDGFPNFFLVDTKAKGKNEHLMFRKQWVPMDVRQFTDGGSVDTGKEESPLKKIKFHTADKEDSESSDDDGSAEEDKEDLDPKVQKIRDKHDADEEGKARHDSLLQQFEDEAERLLDEIRTYDNAPPESWSSSETPYYQQLLARLKFLEGQINNLHSDDSKEKFTQQPKGKKLSKKGTIPERLRLLSGTTGYPITELKRAAKMMAMPLSQYLTVLENM